MGQSRKTYARDEAVGKSEDHNTSRIRHRRPAEAHNRRAEHGHGDDVEWADAIGDVAGDDTAEERGGVEDGDEVEGEALRLSNVDSVGGEVEEGGEEAEIEEGEAGAQEDEGGVAEAGEVGFGRFGVAGFLLFGGDSREACLAIHRLLLGYDWSLDADDNNNHQG